MTVAADPTGTLEVGAKVLLSVTADSQLKLTATDSAALFAAHDLANVSKAGTTGEGVVNLTIRRLGVLSFSCPPRDAAQVAALCGAASGADNAATASSESSSSPTSCGRRARLVLLQMVTG